MVDTESPRELKKQQSSESDIDDSVRTDFSENEHLLGKDRVSSVQKPRERDRIRWRWIWLCLTMANVAILCLTILILVSGRQFSPKMVSYAEAFKKTQEYCTSSSSPTLRNRANKFTAPVYKSFSPSSNEITANGTLFNYPRSIYRNDPSPEVDEEWNRISPNSWLLFTRDEIIQLNKDPETRAKASPSLLKALGYPSDAEMYFGWIDAFHQTHCLNILRRHSYWDYYYSGNYGTWDNAHELHWTHVSHCLDMIRQSLQCNANADIITHVWKEGQAGPYPDFNIQRKCSNFEGLQDWQEKAMVPDELVAKYVVRPADGDIGTLYPAEPELFLAKGVKPAEGRVFDHEVEGPKHWYSSW